MKIAYLGTGCWGLCLASLLASKGFHVTAWTSRPERIKNLCCADKKYLGSLVFTTDLALALLDADLIVESVTSAGIRPVFEKIKNIGTANCPVIVTSKGIEQNTGLILADVIVEILGENTRGQIGFLSGPSFAEEVSQGLPTSVVGTAFSLEMMNLVCEIFTTESFRVYPNADIYGVAFGGALKNVIAIACGISDGLKLGASSRAALMTRGLHEVRKLAVARGCKSETLNGLSGMGDFVLTCNSLLSRNFRYGFLLAEGIKPKEAEKRIEMVVEGVYTCLSALQLSKQYAVPMPIVEVVYEIIHERMSPRHAVQALMQRAVKEEHL